MSYPTLPYIVPRSLLQCVCKHRFFPSRKMIHKLNLRAEDIFILNIGRIMRKGKTVPSITNYLRILINLSALASSFPATEARKPRVKDEIKFLKH